MKLIEELFAALVPPQKIVITHHYNPDADAMGSSLALYHILKKSGHEVHVISPNIWPFFLEWMPGSQSVLNYEEQPEECHHLLSQCDILFSLDYNHYSRTKTMETALRNATGIRVMVDHHLFPSNDFEYGISLPEKSSTCEMVYDLMLSLQLGHLLDTQIAECIYAGAMTDTGSFRYASTHASTHRMVAHLIEAGVVPSRIHQLVFDNYEENRLRLLGYVLSEKMILLPEYHTAIIVISNDELKKFNVRNNETEGIVNYPLGLRNIIFSTFISERDQELRLSFRSKGSWNVNEFARTYFDGGGHANASGGRSLRGINETVELIKHGLELNKDKIKLCYQELINP